MLWLIYTLLTIWCCCCVASVVSNSVRPHKQQPARLPHPWDSPGKNTGVGCHFLPQCMKVKSESEVTQSCLTLSDPMDCSLPGSSIYDLIFGVISTISAIINCMCVCSSWSDSNSILRDHLKLWLVSPNPRQEYFCKIDSWMGNYWNLGCVSFKFWCTQLHWVAL